MSEVLTSDDAALRAYLGRILGYGHTRAIEHALRSIDLGVTRRATLVIVGARRRRWRARRGGE